MRHLLICVPLICGCSLFDKQQKAAWAPGQAPVYVTKDYDHTVRPTMDASIQEISHYEIEHKPRM